MEAALLLKPAEVAVALGLGRTKTYSLIGDGTLPVVRVGRSVRVPSAALARWVESHTADERMDAGA